MYPHGYGNPPPPQDAYRPHQHQHSMMQDRPDQYQHPYHHVQHYPPAYDSPSFPHHSDSPSFPHHSYRPAPAPPFGNNPPPGAPSPAYLQHSFHPTHQSLYPPFPDPYPPQSGLPHAPSFDHSPSAHAYSGRTLGDHILSSSEYADVRPVFGEHSHPSSERSYPLDYTHSPSFPHHTSSFQENKPWILERSSVAPPQHLSSASITDHPPTDVELPKGQLVRVFCKSSRNCNLAVKDGRLTMVEADSGNESQQWIRDDRYSIRVRDSHGQPAFMLINKASKKVLKHASGKLQEVQLTYYSTDIKDDDLFWTESQDFGEGFKTLRMASDTLLNLSVGYGNKIEDGSPIILDTWHKKDTQLWKIFPL